MAGIDRAAIVFSIAIALVGVGVAVAGDAAQSSPTYTAPAVTKEMAEPKTQTESFGADISEKVRSETVRSETVRSETVRSGEDMMEKETVQLEEEITMEETHVKETHEEEVMEETHEEPAGPTTHTVDIPKGTSVPGCEESNACYTPASITINAGDTVEWVNVDTAAHTVTAGLPADVQIEIFDSSLLMADGTWSFTFDDAGSYDYFCMVHPWMVGSVTVN